MEFPYQLDKDTVIEDIDGACPTQAFGTHKGKELYFRFRHNHWRLLIDDKLIDDGYWGDYEDCGDMPAEKVIEIIKECI